MSTLVSLFKDSFADLVHLIFPSVCAGCNDILLKNEETVCITCLGKLPKTNFHNEPDNPVERSFWGKLDISRATAFLYFNKGSVVQHMMHQLKYDNHPQIGVALGKMMAYDLKESEFLKGVDFIVPIPLHPSKQKKRGYNQSAEIAKGLSESSCIPCQFDVLIRVKETATQTKKSRFDRWKNVETVFHVTDPTIFINKHILLVDDVITTGSTIEACGITLLKAGAGKVSVATAAFAMV